ncbi:MAG: cob(I)yrinic acid a,c-diamide adenosyltransferase [Oscillospiraceae bacterium]|nr:cob(I)yrinic acid a,c-diamide adenosyltransferase [Oscillospiraceae bacterium]
MSARGLTHIYYGNGKGKTTAALGLAMRASGCGKKVVIVQFLKDWKCGEQESLALLQNITVFGNKASGGGFVKDMTAEGKLALTANHNDNLKAARNLVEQGGCDLLILDEAIDAYQLGVLDAALFEDILENKPEQLELIITGHMPDEKLLEHADYVTQMLKHKHPYDKGIMARRGIEF